VRRGDACVVADDGSVLHVGCAIDTDPALARRAFADVRDGLPFDPALLAGWLAAATSAREPTTEALLARLAESPDDHAAYAVLADHLHALGDPRGELIALELAIAGGAPAHALDDRRRALQRELGMPGAESGGPVTATWGIGYYRRVAVSSDTALAPIWRHPDMRLLRELQVYFGNRYTDAQVDRVVRNLPRTIRVVDLRRPRPLSLAVTLAAALPRLEVLAVRGPFDIAGLAHPRLRCVELADQTVGADLADAMAALAPAALPRLDTVVARTNGSLDRACMELADRGVVAQLVSLELHDGAISAIGADALARGLGDRRLGRLDIAGVTRTPDVVRRLAGLCRILYGADDVPHGA